MVREVTGEYFHDLTWPTFCIADPKTIRDQLLNILLASRDTTSCLLTFVTYFMAMHPDVAARLRKEVADQVGLDRTPTFDDIRNMRYRE